MASERADSDITMVSRPADRVTNAVSPMTVMDLPGSWTIPPHAQASAGGVTVNRPIVATSAATVTWTIRRSHGPTTIVVVPLIGDVAYPRQAGAPRFHDVVGVAES
ncbi:hypothetical protein GCM10008112_44230 [Flexivirga endophytica]|nr:hypothetical protein GCM10008112_44230 [Flexivirga endophytica]